MKNYTKIFNIFLFLYTFFLANNIYANTIIQKPLLDEITIERIKKDSIIQVPISIHAREIEKAILREIKTPVASDILHKKPFDIKYKVHLKNLEVFFEGSKIKILSSYLLDFSVNYKDSMKGILDGKVYADLSLVGNISINDDATFTLNVSQKEVNTKFTKVEIPSLLNKFDFLQITKAERYLAEKFLQETINKRIFKRVQQQISKKQVDIQLHQRIQKLVYKHSFATLISKDLWLVPQASAVSLSQVSTKNKAKAKELLVNIGITAQPKLITSATQPLLQHLYNIPIDVKSFQPKVYLYPRVYINYDYVQTKIEDKLNLYISKHYGDLDYAVKNVTLYPSGKKLIISVDLMEGKDPQKILTFYLWGTPTLNKEQQSISLNNFDYTLDSKNALVHTANWLLDEGIKNLIYEKTIFSYKKKMQELYKKISSVEKRTTNGVLKATTQTINIQDIAIAKDALIIYATAKGSISYSVLLNTTKEK